MKGLCVFCATLATASYVDAFAPKTPKAVADLQKAAAGAFAAVTIATSPLNIPAADAVVPSFLSSSTTVAETVTREGFYGEYTVDVTDQKYDDFKSTFKDAKETKSKKGKYTALLAVLIVGSFIIPMAQYFWYVRDDDSSDVFFGQKNDPPPPPPPPKKKGWF